MSFFATWYWTNSISLALFWIQNNIRIQYEKYSLFCQYVHISSIWQHNTISRLFDDFIQQNPEQSNNKYPRKCSNNQKYEYQISPGGNDKSSSFGLFNVYLRIGDVWKLHCMEISAKKNEEKCSVANSTKKKPKFHNCQSWQHWNPLMACVISLCWRQGSVEYFQKDNIAPSPQK